MGRVLAWNAILLLATGTIAGTALPATAPAQELEARFIANAGFSITDGEATILVDFPYRSGAFGYMVYGDEELSARNNSLCLFTHRHADHFEAELVSRVGCSVAGPAEVLGFVAPEQRAGQATSWSFGDAEIRCVDSDHGDVGHCSFVIAWQGTVIYVVGDVEELSVLEQVEAIDVAVLPAWLAPQAGAVRARFPEASVVITHHTAGDDLSTCGACIVPQQGEPIVW